MITTNSVQLTGKTLQCATPTIMRDSLSRLTIEIVQDRLVMWGKFHRYGSRCGYQRMSAFWKSVNSTKTTVFIEKEVDVVDEILRSLKHSSCRKEQQQYAVLEAYYKGADLVVDGYDWSQKLTVREIAEYLNLPKSTVANRKKLAEHYVLNQLLNKS